MLLLIARGLSYTPTVPFRGRKWDSCILPVCISAAACPGFQWGRPRTQDIQGIASGCEPSRSG